MHDARSHAAFVDAWLAAASRTPTAEADVALLESALQALWRSSVVTLGDVTLTAIAERVLQSAAEKYPLLAVISVSAREGFVCRGLRSHPGETTHTAALAATRHLLVEFLTVIGTLTAELLTPQLQTALVGLAEPTPAAPRKPGASSGPSTPRAEDPGEPR